MNRSLRPHRGLISSLALICALVYGSTLTSLSQFLEPMQAEFGWSSEQTSMLVSAFLLASSLSFLISGWLIDRFSPKWIMLSGLVLTSTAFAAVGVIPSLAGILCALTISGAGVGACGMVSAISIVGRKIPKFVGLVSGILMAATAAGCALLPSVTGYAIATLGWRSTIIGIGCFLAVTCIPLILRFIPRAEHPSKIESSGENKREAGDVKSSVSSGFFVGLISIQLLFNLGFMGTFFFFIPFLLKQGYSAESAGALYGLMNIAVVPGALVVGWLSDRMNAMTLLMLGLLANGTTVFLLDLVVGPSHSLIALVSFVICSGLSQGTPTQLAPVLIARTIGTRNYGTLNGISSIVTGVAGAAGPALTGFIYDRSASYLMAFEVGAALVLAAAVLALALQRRTALQIAAISNT